jgi:ParB family chromosome partitioning protein
MSSRIVAEIEIPALNIRPNPDNPRVEAGDVAELRNSIMRYGLLQSVLVREDTERGKDRYILEAGERRWTACRLIRPGYMIAARVIQLPNNMPQWMHAIIVGMHENDHRKQLNAMERARAYGRLRDEAEMTQAQVADTLGTSAYNISRYLGLLELSVNTQKRVESGELSVEAALKHVKRHRAQVRKGKGHQPVDVGWEPDHFTSKHFLARKAAKLCKARGHNNRRKLADSDACGACWEHVVRQDEAVVQVTSWREQGFELPFLTPEMAAVGNVLGKGKGNGGG